MQRKLDDTPVQCVLFRNISAHAEKTKKKSLSRSMCRKHLCVCRENVIKRGSTWQYRETSLRMQRKRKRRYQLVFPSRNISAHAEKTVRLNMIFIFLKKHLCACRENASQPLPLATLIETSLRMQRKLIIIFLNHSRFGNISAHAEKTGKSFAFSRCCEKHLCACRENGLETVTEFYERETSLRMQRKRGGYTVFLQTYRNISAHAEKTLMKTKFLIMCGKHLCACRENQDTCYSIQEG